MATLDSIVIVGGGLAGAKAAETLREEGFEGRVVLVAEEPVRPYERPPLTQDYLRGKADFDTAAVHPEGYYEAHDIELRTSATATDVDPAACEAELSSGERIHYDRLLLATGAEPIRPPIPGAELDGVHYLRTVADADALRQAITTSGPVVVIGAGWIGAEVTASARQLGAEVAMLGRGNVPLERVLGEEIGGVYRDLHTEHGVALHIGAGAAAEAIEGTGRVEAVRLSDGTVLPAGTVVVGVGVRPRLALAEAAGLDIANGVVTDEHLATSAPGIYAAGDIASVYYPLYGTRIRLEHWSGALNQGPVAARNMLGADEAYDKTPYFYSDQYDFGMEYRGWVPSFEQVVVRGDCKGREFLAFWLHDGVVGAAMNANTWDQGDALEALVRARVRVEPEKLADPSVDLAGLL